METVRGNVADRAMNGLYRHPNSSQKGTNPSANVIFLGNTESRKITRNGGRQMIARASDDRRLIRSLSKILVGI